MNEMLSWPYEWKLIVWTSWIIFYGTHFASWNISILFFRNENFKFVKEKFHRISPPLELLQNSQENTSGKVSFFIKLEAEAIASYSILRGGIPFKNSKVTNPPTYGHTKKWLHWKCFLCLFQEFSKLLGDCLWWNNFLVKQQKLLHFATLSRNLKNCMVQKSSSSSPFNRRCRLTVYSLQLY